MKAVLAAVNAKYIHTNLAVRCLAACAHRQGLPVEVAEYTVNQPFDQLLAGLYGRAPDVLGFSCYLWNIQLVKALCAELKKLLPGVFLFLGGPEVSYTGPALLRELPQVGAVLQGEGEESFPALLRALAGELPMDQVPGLVFRQGEEIRAALPAAPFDLAQMPFPYPELETAEGAEGLAHKILYFETSRGCPFRCTYCLSAGSGGVRLMPPALACRYLDVFLKRRVPQVKLVDRTFNCSPVHADAILSHLIAHDNGVTNFHFEIEAELLADSTLALIRSAREGLFQFEAGVQSANPQTLRAIRRGGNVERLLQRAALLREPGNAHLHMDLIAGLPLEGYESFARSFDTVYRANPHMLQLGFLKVLHGSVLEEEAERWGIVYQSRAPYEVLYTPWLSYEELQRLKRIDILCDGYHNSGRFSASLPWAMAGYRSPFRFFQELGDYIAGRDGFAQAWGKFDGHRYLLEFCRARRAPEETKRLAWLLRHDVFCGERARGLPGFLQLPVPAGAAEQLAALRREKTAMEALAPRLRGLPPRERTEAEKRLHLAWFPFSPLTGQAGPHAVLYDYDFPTVGGAARTGEILLEK